MPPSSIGTVTGATRLPSTACAAATPHRRNAPAAAVKVCIMVDSRGSAGLIGATRDSEDYATLLSRSKRPRHRDLPHCAQNFASTAMAAPQPAQKPVEAAAGL